MVSEFLLTHPVWDVTEEIVNVIHDFIISTHTSRVGCDSCPLVAITILPLFLLTHPVWDVTPFGIPPPIILSFLLTHPVWDVTSCILCCSTHI